MLPKGSVETHPSAELVECLVERVGPHALEPEAVCEMPEGDESVLGVSAEINNLARCLRDGFRQ